MPKAKPEMQRRSRELRQEGVPIKQIAKRLGVSCGSVHRWCKGIELSAEQKLKIKRDTHAIQQAKLAAYNERKQREARHRQFSGKRAGARLLIEAEGKDKPLLLLGAGLYMGDGDKRSRGAVRLSNMDPVLLRLFIHWLVLFDVEPRKLRATLHLSPDFSAPEEVAWWAQELGIYPDQFGKVVTKMPSSSGGKTKREDYHGILSLGLNNAYLKAQIEGLIEASLNMFPSSSG